jgi:hypothetical protein
MNARQFAIDFYLDYFNNYLTVEKIAEHHLISVELAQTLINHGKAAHLGIDIREG